MSDEQTMAVIINGGNESNNSVEQSCKKESQEETMRWDLMFLCYFVAVYLFAMVMGVSTLFNRVIFGFGYLHFATEDLVAFHMLYSRKTAKILSIVFCVMYLLEAVFVAPFAPLDTVKKVFYVQFIFSDLLSALCAASLMLNRSASQQMRNCAFAVLLHFIGVSLSLARIPIMYFFEENLMHRGESWVLYGIASYFGLYYLRDALGSKCNFGQEHLFSFPLWTQIVVPVVCVSITMGYGVMSLLRTTEDDGSMEIAASIWDEVITWTAWPLGGVGIIIAFKMQSDGRAALNKKL